MGKASRVIKWICRYEQKTSNDDSSEKIRQPGSSGVVTHLFGIVAAMMEVCLGLMLEPTDQRKRSTG